MAKKQFKAESKRLLDLMINSIYTHKEIFLREIISNASDAMDKLAYQALTDQNVGLNRDDFRIDIKADKKYGILTISDNGIGMTKEEMETNLGTIAKSGSFQFKKDVQDAEDVDIIGQFGVGFYSAFMVADNVTVVSRHYGEETACMWQSSGADGYTLTECERENVGTDVILKLKADTEDEKYSEYLDEYRIRNLIKRYSDYIRYPICMDVEKRRPVEKAEGADENAAPEMETYTENETLNSRIPLWQRSKSEVTEEELQNFYRDKFFDYEAPVVSAQISAEGTVSYKSLLFVPARAPFDFYTKDYKAGLQLYSSGVMIMDTCADLLPEHFRFVKGIVDSQDLSLNISREMLQHDRQLRIIKNSLEKKVKSELVKLMENDREKYETFFGAFGMQLKYGAVAEYGAHKDMLQDLLLFWSAKEQKLVSLKEYCAAMPEQQKYIYFAVGESRSRMAQLPQAELLNAKGYDLLLLTDDVDEFAMQILGKYDEKQMRNALTEDLELQSDEEKEAAEKKAEDAKELLTFVKDALEDKVQEVRLSGNLGRHPVSLASATGMSFEMEKYLKRVNPNFTETPGRILELNPEHPVFATLSEKSASDPDTAKKYASLLYYQALLVADLPIEDPSAYTDLVCELMK